MNQNAILSSLDAIITIESLIHNGDQVRAEQQKIKTWAKTRREARVLCLDVRQALAFLTSQPLSTFCECPPDVQAEVNRILVHADAFYEKLEWLEAFLDRVEPVPQTL